MSVRTTILGPAVLVAMLMSTVEAQTRGRGQRPSGTSNIRQSIETLSGLRRSPEFISGGTTKRNRLSTYDSSTYSGVITRLDQVRAITPPSSPSIVRGFQPLAPSPIQEMLDRRNLLGVRSTISKKTISSVGRSIYPKSSRLDAPPQFTMTPSMTSLPTSAPVDPTRPIEARLGDALELRLSRLADEYFDNGARAFTKGKFIQARNYFDLVRELEPAKCRSHIATCLVATQRTDFATAWWNVLQAIEIAESADDLRIDLSRFYKNTEDSRRTREAVNKFALANPNIGSVSGVLAYFSFLNGDLGTASDAAANAEKYTPSAAAEPIKKFRGMLAQLRTTPASRPAN